MVAPWQIHPLAAVDLSEAERKQAIGSATEGYTAFVVMTLWLGLGLAGPAAESHKAVSLAILVAIPVLLAVGFHVYRRVRDARIAARCISEAATCTARAKACHELVSQLPDTLARYVGKLDSEITDCEHRLRDGMTETFWDEVDTAYASIQLMKRDVKKVLDSANTYRSMLVGRKHSCPPLSCRADTGSLQRVFERYRAMLTSAERNVAVVQVFEQRRHGRSWMPTFKSLRTASHEVIEALAEILKHTTASTAA